MIRRQAIRFAASFAFASALGKYDALAQDGGFLTVDLNKWQGLKILHRDKKTNKNKVLYIPAAEVFAALEEGPQQL